ncbi:MAG: hypothetical protein IKI48_02370 [Prevotella sp.]|nr:hypothetical protein [Prevotella sp.]MBR7093630.1 hypothetical protein [Prevotella sp.]
MAAGRVHVGHPNAVRHLSTDVPLSGDIFRPASVIPLVEPLAAFVYLCKGGTVGGCFVNYWFSVY